MEDATDPQDENEQLHRARRGDSAAFATLYQQHAQAIFALAWRLLGDRSAAEDIVQESFLRMFGFLSGLRDGTPIRPWLKRVAANLAIDQLRRERRHREESFDEAGFSVSNEPDADASTIDLLRRLPPLARTLVWLHEMEGWSHQELAERFGRSPSWSKSVISRALARLRSELDPSRTP